MAGVDMSMVPLDFSFHDICVDLAKEDPAFMARVNDATMRILKVFHYFIFRASFQLL